MQVRAKRDNTFWLHVKRIGDKDLDWQILYHFVEKPIDFCTNFDKVKSGSHRVGGIENVNTIDERRKKIVRNRVYDCHLSPDWRQMTIENTVYSDFDSRSSIVQSVFDCRLPGVRMVHCIYWGVTIIVHFSPKIDFVKYSVLLHFNWVFPVRQSVWISNLKRV